MARQPKQVFENQESIGSVSKKSYIFMAWDCPDGASASRVSWEHSSTRMPMLIVYRYIGSAELRMQWSMLASFKVISIF